MKKTIVKAFIISSLALVGCSSSQQASSDYDSTNTKNKIEENTEGLKCNESISVQEGESINLQKYCTYNGKSDEDIVVSPSTVSTKKVGKQSVDVTVTDPDGVIYYYSINVNITAKPTPTPSPTPTPTPTPEETPESTPETVSPSNSQKRNNYSNFNSNSNSSSTQQQMPVQQPAAEPATQPSRQQTAGEGDAVTTKKKASGGAAAGSTYDSVAACDAAATTTQSHTCSFNAELQKYVLTYN